MSPATKKVLRYCFLSVALIIGLLVATIFIIRSRTIGQWNDFKTHWEAQGEHFDIEHFIPAPIPDEQNLAMHPVFKDLWIENSETAQRLDAIDVTTLEGFNQNMLNSSRQRGHRRDYSEWEDLDENLSPEERITEILSRFEPFNEEMNRIAEAMHERPQCQFPFEWDFAMGSDSDHIFKFLTLSKAFSVRTQLRLRNKEAALALDDLTTNRHFSVMVSQEDNLIAFLVEIALLHAYLGDLWEGLTSHSFNDAQLQKLDESLPAQNHIAERCMQSLRFERASILQVVDTMGDDPTRLDPGINKKAKWLSIWWTKSRLAVSQDLQEQILFPGGTPATRPTVANAERFKMEFDKRRTGMTKYTQALAIMAVPDFQKAIGRALQIEAELNNARLAIALERYHLKHNSYPTKLSALVPNFLPVLPTDELNHRPIEYRLRSDGTPLIYQWGGDGDDDRATPRHSLLHGDLVWQFPLKTPVTHEEYRRED